MRFNTIFIATVACLVATGSFVKATEDDLLGDHQVDGLDLDPSAVDLQPAGLDLDHSEADLEPAGLDLDHSDIDLQPAGLDLDHSDVDLQPAGFDLDHSDVDLHPTLDNPLDIERRSIGSTGSGIGSGLQSAKSQQQAKGLAALRKTPGGKGSSAAAIKGYMRLNSAKYKLKKATDFS
ncbi:hypothetical protein J3Q64DRAFT_1836627 [Phycomyces blakesleeanus]|uniref:Uncharacterized protein n=2 Tax=Phycomyces blakesleeanus TaxID=4837 RepID=A0A167PPK7_PHYB8|nr:hypothetical protein PHYBLDRAFT_69753 [Phycomyces blakesleeanus NRRL 1555(-)]OAD78308.1 hypothetical protein PHYBLDRAFT_69753 [Phycomyces blakesleeanus NRRL 1555(-)]|eukprot:XP_018296348.1 hypothetical protein PHYBLDRAFT_69753 [Phycomyces blakesleeanus NRRL 1555(-)]